MKSLKWICVCGALASLSSDGAVLEQARAVAFEITANDPELTRLPVLARLLAQQRQRVSDAAAQLN